MEEGAKEEKKEISSEKQESQEVKQEHKTEQQPQKQLQEQVKEKPVKKVRKLNFKMPKFKTNTKFWIIFVSIILLIAIIYFGVWIRIQNVPNLKDISTGQYTLGPDLDPFLFLRYAQEIQQTGSLSKIDMMRYPPAGGVLTHNSAFIPYTIYYLYKFITLFSKDTIIQFAAIINPVIFFALGLLFFFLFIQKVFSYIFTDKTKKEKLIYSIAIALIATALLIVLPAYLHRTMAGIPEKEPPGMFFLWLSFYLFFSAWQSKGKKSLVFALLAGISTALMSWSWGGVKFIFMTFALFAFLTFFFNKINKKQIATYSTWLIISFLIMIFIFRTSTTQSFFTGIDTLFAFGIFIVLIIDYILFNTKIKEKIKLEKIKLPHQLTSLLIILIFGTIFGSIFFGFNFILSKLIAIREGLLYPFGHSRVGLTVAENKQPFFMEWLGQFTRIFFWLFFFGTLFLFYESIKHFDNKNKFWFNFFFIFFLITFILSKYSPSSIFNGTNTISQIFYFGGLILFVLVIFFSYLNAYIKKDEKILNDFKKINFSYIFMLVFIFWMVLAARGAIRIFFISGTAFIIAVAFIPIKLISYGIKSKDLLQKIILWSVVIIVVCLISISFMGFARTSIASAKGTIPGAYYQQWQKAMSWVRNNTTEDSLFIHWWDYGYWVQTLGQRATVTDGGHAIGYWDHLTGRYLLTAQEEKTTLQLCKTYGVDYLLIDSTDIGKYPAYSSIGSDKEGNDRLSWVNTFIMDETQTQDTRNETIYVYVGSTVLDEDILWKGEIFPQGKAGIGGFIMTLDQETQGIKNLESVVIYNNKQYRVPLKFVFINDNLVKINDNGIGTLYIVPKFTQQSINHIGAALYLSEKAMATQWVRLYLFNDSENFELVHNEPASFVEQLRNNYDFPINDLIVVNSAVYGPIKIWKINYPEDIEKHEEYLKTQGEWGELDYLGT